MKRLILSFYLLICLPIISLSQSSTEIKSLLLNDNEISLELYNYGSFSRPGALADIQDFAWSGLGYMYEFGLVVGAEVEGNNGDTLKIISDSFVSPSEGDYDPSGMLKWGWLPVEGYANSSGDQIANSRNPNSWPLGWNNWPGEYGEGEIVANNEAYYKIKDFTNYEFIARYQPIEGNNEIGGLGLSLEVRVYQFGGGLKDALIVKYFLTNESEKKLDNVIFGFWADPHIGGVGDTRDDQAFFVNSSLESDKILSSQTKNTIHFIDTDYIGRGGVRPGYLGMKILESPLDKGLTSFKISPWGAVDPKDDEIVWEFLEGGIDTLSETYLNPTDNVVTFGTGSFSLDVSETKEVKIAIFFSNNYNDVLTDATYIGLHHNWPMIKSDVGSTSSENNYKIKLESINSVIRDSYDIIWDNSTLPNNANIFLESSYNSGLDWSPIAVAVKNTNKFTWNTKDVKDGANYLLRIVAYNEENPKDYYFEVAEQKFTIDNLDFNAKPELELLSQITDTTIIESPINIKWKIEDADNNPVNIILEYANYFDGPYSEIYTGEYNKGNHTYVWDVTELPNADTYYIRITATDSDKDSVVISNPFSIDIFEGNLSQSHIQSINGDATPNIYIQTIDNSALTSDEYSILFHVSDDSKTFDIKNVTKDEILLLGYAVDESISTPLIDGFKIKVQDTGNNIDYSKTKFVSSSVIYNDYEIQYPPILGGDKLKVDEDFLFIFNESDTLENGQWINADTMATLIGDVRAPFSIWSVEGRSPNFTRMEPATFVLYEPHPRTQNNGQWDWNESIVFQPFGSQDATTTYQVNLNNYNRHKFNSEDSLYLVTFNEIQDNDEFRFWMDSTLVNVLSEIISNITRLYQNYPNPFNPSTKISFDIQYDRKVSLAIYNILGEKVKTLINQHLKAGYHETEFNNTSLSSGIYFYRIEAGDFVETKKMILLK